MLSPRRLLGSATARPHVAAMSVVSTICARALSATALAGALLLLAGPLPGAPAHAQAIASSGVEELSGAARAEALAKASAALNALRQVEGRFQQVAPDGSLSSGAFQLQRPGKVRFAYDPPTPFTLTSDGVTVAFEDRKLKSVDRTPLRATPLFFVLKSEVDLAADARVVRVAHEGGQLLIDLRDRKGEAEGLLTLVFAGASEPELRGWRITDGSGQLTSISLKDVRPATRLDARLFRVEEGDDSTGRRLGGR